VVAGSDWDALTPEQQKSFAPLTPLFLVELRSSENDSLSELQEKMREYQSVGVPLGWLIDPVTEQVHVYEAEEEPVGILDQPERVSADPILPGFELDLSRVWSS